MNRLVLALFLLSPVAAHAQYGGYGTYGGVSHHEGYETQRGTYVEPHYQTEPNNTRMDNWSTRGNTNPYTGKPGYENPYGQ